MSLQLLLVLLAVVWIVYILLGYLVPYFHGLPSSPSMPDKKSPKSIFGDFDYAAATSLVVISNWGGFSRCFLTAHNCADLISAS